MFLIHSRISFFRNVRKWKNCVNWIENKKKKTGSFEMIWITEKEGKNNSEEAQEGTPEIEFDDEF